MTNHFELRRTLSKGALERRSQHSVPELRAADDGTLELRGYAATFGNWYDIGGQFRERLAPGAFTRTLNEEPDVVLNLSHGDAGSGLPLARTGRNLFLSQDNHGLRVRASLDPADPDVQLLRAKMNAGLIDRMSFAFRVNDDTWSEDRSERTIKSVTLHRGDVSVVVVPANDMARAELVARSAAAAPVKPWRPAASQLAREQRILLQQRHGVASRVSSSGRNHYLTTAELRARLKELRTERKH